VNLLSHHADLKPNHFFKWCVCYKYLINIKSLKLEIEDSYRSKETLSAVDKLKLNNLMYLNTLT